MHLRDWSAGRLGRAWLLGLLLQAGVLGTWAAYGRLTETPEQRQLRREGEAMRARTDSVHAVVRAEDDSVRRGLKPPRPTLAAAQEAHLRQFLRDSLGISWETHGTVTTVHLPPPLAEQANRAVTQIGNGFRQLILIAALLLLPIPTALLILTAAWLWLRRPWTRRAEPAAAA